MAKALFCILIVALSACATPSPVRQLFDQQNLRYPVDIAPPRADTPRPTVVNLDPAEQPAQEYASLFFDLGVRNLRSLASYRQLRQFASAEAFALGPPSLWQDSPGALCLIVPFSAYQTEPIAGEVYIPVAYHSVGKAEVIELQNLLLLCPSGGKWELICCSL